jgi:hypothetical protein
MRMNFVCDKVLLNTWIFDFNFVEAQEKVFISWGGYLVVRFDYFIHFNIDEVVEQINVLLYQSCNAQKFRNQLPFILNPRIRCVSYEKITKSRLVF